MNEREIVDTLKDVSKTVQEIQVSVGIISNSLETLSTSVEKHCDKCAQTHIQVEQRINALEVAKAKTNGMMHGIDQTKTRTIGIAQLLLIGLSSLLSSGVTIVLFYLGKILN